VALACLASSPTSRSNVVFATYAAGWPLDKPGLQIFMWIPDTDEPWKRSTLPFATSVTSWSTVMLIAATAIRRTVLPAPVAALLLGGAVLAVDSLLADAGEAREAKKAIEADAEADA